jgi:endonuclease III
MKDEDIHVVLKLVKSSVTKFKPPFVTGLAHRQGGVDPFLVLIACLLTLRTRDKVAYEAFCRLTAIARDPFEMANLHVGEIEAAIYPVGFYRNKSRQIIDISKKIAVEFMGKVPHSIEELLRLKGVGRKTSNLVVTVGFGRPGICVDIHVHRICNRLGYVRTRTPDETEEELREKLPIKYWKSLNKWLVLFGQNQCVSRFPYCGTCPVKSYCAKFGVNGN